MDCLLGRSLKPRRAPPTCKALGAQGCEYAAAAPARTSLDPLHESCDQKPTCQSQAHPDDDALKGSLITRQHQVSC
jgi:hypothetical protein